MTRIVSGRYHAAAPLVFLIDFSYEPVLNTCMMRKLLTGIYLVVLLLAQFASISHAVEHKFDDSHKNLPQHECILCHGDSGVALLSSSFDLELEAYPFSRSFVVETYKNNTKSFYTSYQGRSPPFILIY